VPHVAQQQPFSDDGSTTKVRSKHALAECVVQKLRREPAAVDLPDAAGRRFRAGLVGIPRDQRRSAAGARSAP